MEQGCFKTDEFLRERIWSTPSSIRSNATSFKKFYECMPGHGAVEKESYDYPAEMIRKGMKFWTGNCEQYNPGGLNPFWQDERRADELACK